MPNALMNNYLEKMISTPTVILSFRCLLENHIENGIDASLTKSEVHKAFNSSHKEFGVQTFRRDYILRQSGDKEKGIEQIEGTDKKFRIRKPLLEGLTTVEMKAIVNSINSFYAKKRVEQQSFLTALQTICDSEEVEIYSYIKSLLEKPLSDDKKRGQEFEVTSFSILCAYYAMRGFTLNRFSTVYANDGGVDFAAQNAIYQVTTHLDSNKFNEDIAKVPLTKRVLVYKETTGNFDKSLFNNEWILDYISCSEIVTHLDYIRSKKGKSGLLSVMSTILHEFKRELYFN